MASNLNLKKYLAGPHHAKTSKRWLPSPPAKIDICTNEKVVVPGKLYYFEVEGRACGIRMLLAHANVNYVDARQSGEAFGALKKQGALPLGSMPVWEENGFKMCQSSAILRMLGVRHGYYSQDPMTCWAIDSLVDFIEDHMGPAMSIYLPVFGGKPFDESLAPAWFEKFWDKVLPVLEARLSGHGKKFLAGTDRPTIADFKAFQTVICNLDSNSACVLTQGIRATLK